ncbi:MAG: alpha/beta hydrolase fold domain-containing protein [Celeribacter sp.]|jgi:acetyl esterase/lipase
MNYQDIASRADLEDWIRQIDMSGTPDQRRAGFRRLVGPQPIARPKVLGGVPGRMIGRGARVIVWLHGGGYMFGGSDTHGRPARRLAELTGWQVFVPDYRLAPEHPWPAMLDDALAVLTALGPSPVVGDGAGGHLALQAARRRHDLVQRLALVSPNTDRSGLSETRRRDSATDLMNDDATDTELASMAFGDRPGDDPDLSPIFGDLEKLPPLCLTASTSERLLDDTLLLARAAGLAGVEVKLDLLRDLFHRWVLWPDILPQAEQTLCDIAVWLLRDAD